MTAAVSFSFDAGPHKRLTSNERLHWARRAGRTAIWRQLGCVYGLRTRPRGSDHLPPSNVHVTFEVSDPNRRRDPMNAYPTVKALIDGITDAGYFPDDDSRWVTVIEPSFVRGIAGRVRIDITPREADGYLRARGAAKGTLPPAEVAIRRARGGES